MVIVVANPVLDPALVSRHEAIRLLLESNKLDEAEQRIQNEILGLLTLAAERCQSGALYEKAYQFAKVMMACCPEHAHGYHWAARSLVAARKFSELAKTCLSAVEHCSHDTGLCAGLIANIYGLGLYEEALQASLLLIQKQALALDPYFLGAQSSVALERFDQARQILVQAMDTLPEAGAWLKTQLDYLNLTVGAYRERLTYPLYDLWRCCYQFKLQDLRPVSVERTEATDLIPIQYWSQPDPPEDVLALTAEWNRVLGELGLPAIRLFNHDMARDWIAAWAPQFLTAFDTAPHFSSESDVFRIAFTTRHSSIYIDSDMYPTEYTLRTMSLLIGEGSSGLYVYKPTPYLQGAFYVARLGCPFFARIAEELAYFDYNSEEHARYSMFELIHDYSFGPGIFNRVLRSFCQEETPKHRSDPAYPLVQTLAFADFRLQFCSDDSIGMSKPGLSYKGSSCSWQVWSRSQPRA